MDGWMDACTSDGGLSRSAALHSASAAHTTQHTAQHTAQHTHTAQHSNATSPAPPSTLICLYFIVDGFNEQTDSQAD